MFQYPYGDSQQLNLDWLMEQWLETKASIDGSLQGEIDRVEAAITDLLTARDQAVAAQTAAETAATSASGYAGTASGAASTATAEAAAAAASAALAGNHASNAQTSETNAGLQATAAGNSASAAAVSEGNARNSELAAAASSSAAAGNALYAEGFAVGEQNGTPVSSGSPYYENNAKYYELASEGFAVGEQEGTPVTSGSPYYENNSKYYADAAAAVAASIPADYTQLSNDVDSLKNVVGIPTEEFLFKDAFKKSYSFNTYSRSGKITGNHIEITGTGSTSVPVSFPVMGNLNAAFNSTNWSGANLIESDFITLPDNCRDFGISFIFDEAYSSDQNSSNGMSISIWTWQNNQAVLVARSTNSRRNYSKSLVFNAILSTYPILRQTKKLYVILNSDRITNGKNQSLRFLITSSVTLELFNVIARNNETNYTATVAHAVNDIFTASGILYRATTAIAIGEEIIPNTNCTRIWITDILTYLLNNI